MIYLGVNSKSLNFKTIFNKSGNQMVTSVIVKTLTKEVNIDVAYSISFSSE